MFKETAVFQQPASTVAALTVVLPPSITVQPVSQGVMPGSNATLNVTATGTPPLNYHWYLNSTNLFQATTNGSLTITNLNSTNVGQYTVVVSNAYGGTTSQVAVMAFPPVLVSQPTDGTVLPGSNAMFNVTASGVGPFTYQWQFNGTNLPDKIISTVAGNGNPGYAGDGGVALNASLNNPVDVACDGVGNIYISDANNNRVRKVGTNGIVSTIAGTGTSSSTGAGGLATNADITSRLLNICLFFGFCLS